MKRMIALVIAGSLLMLAVGCNNSNPVAPAIAYVNPPVNISDKPLSFALGTIFSQAGVRYSIEISGIDDYGNASLTVSEKTELDTVLNLILAPRNMKYSQDSVGVYHIKR